MLVQEFTFHNRLTLIQAPTWTGSSSTSWSKETQILKLKMLSLMKKVLKDSSRTISTGKLQLKYVAPGYHVKITAKANDKLLSCIVNCPWCCWWGSWWGSCWSSCWCRYWNWSQSSYWDCGETNWDCCRCWCGSWCGGSNTGCYCGDRRGCWWRNSWIHVQNWTSHNSHQYLRSHEYRWLQDNRKYHRMSAVVEGDTTR